MNSFAYITLLGYHSRGGSKDSRGGGKCPPPPPPPKRNPAGGGLGMRLGLGSTNFNLNFGSIITPRAHDNIIVLLSPPRDHVVARINTTATYRNYEI